MARLLQREITVRLEEAKEKLVVSSGGSVREAIRLIVVGIVAAWLGAAAYAQDSEPVVGRGVVVEEVGKGSTLEKAGIEPGDVLLSWRRLPSPPANPEEARGEFESVWDWMWVVIEQAPRGVVELSGKRESKLLELVVVPGSWAAEIRPNMSERVSADYQQGREYMEAGETADGARQWTNLAHEAENEFLRCWLSLLLGETWGKQREWEKADVAFRSALGGGLDRPLKAILLQSIGDAYAGGRSLDQAKSEYSSAIDIYEKLELTESLGLARAISRMANVQRKLGDVLLAKHNYTRALELRRKLAPTSLGVASSLNDLGNLSRGSGDLDKAKVLYRESLAIRLEVAPDSLDTAGSYNNLGIVAEYSNDFSNAIKLYKKALSLKQELSPFSNGLAATLTNLCSLSNTLGDLDAGAQYCERALDIYEQTAPNSVYHAGVLNNIGNLEDSRGHLDAAEQSLDAAIDIYRHVAPTSLGLAKSLSNRGRMATERGEIDEAMHFHTLALEIKQEVAPGSMTVASSLNHLGIVCVKRNDLERAQSYFQRALDIREKASPGSLDVAMALNNLSFIVFQSGDTEHAKELQLRALAIQESKAPRSLHTAKSLGNIGNILREDGDLTGAAEFHRKSLELKSAIAAGSLYVAASLHSLGEISLEKGERASAMEFYKESLEISRELAPHSAEFSETLYSLAVLYRLSGKVLLAEDCLRQALSAIERQFDLLGGSHDRRSGFFRKYKNIYREYLEIQIDQGDVEAAFHTLERSRARGFLEHLTERDAVFTLDVPEDLDRKRRSIAIRIDRTQRKLSQMSRREHAEEIRKLEDGLQRLHGEAGDVEELIRRKSPRLAALRYPEPLALEAARDALDPGTLMLSYSVGEESTVLFALSQDSGLVVHELAITKDVLQSRVQEYSRDIRRARRRGSQHMRKLVLSSRDLYLKLMASIESLLDASKRILIVADGPLHYLSWASLIRETPGGLAYLAEWKPVHMALSATVFSEVKNLRRNDDEPNPEVQIAAFGDPQYPGRSTVGVGYVDPVVRSASERCKLDFGALAHTRYEVEAVARNFDNAQVYLGGRATEERVKALDRTVRIVHIAAHGCVDEFIPLNSFVALSIPGRYQEGRDNGLLQAWEIFERVRLDAELVVLSACETALGEERGGEGLYGLTRAFQYAGARSVAASLWEVVDQTTAELMIRFYSHLRSGLSKDEALRAAQLEFIRGPIEMTMLEGNRVMKDASAPYYWAGFQIYGDWQ